MFDDITDLEHRDGVRGFLARHFSPVTHADVAKDEAELISSVFFFLAGTTALLVAIRTGILSAPGPIILAVLAGLLRISVSRIAALLLLALTCVNAVLSLPALMPLVFVIIAARATQLTFAYHRLVTQQATPPAAPAEPDSSSAAPPGAAT